MGSSSSAKLIAVVTSSASMVVFVFILLLGIFSSPISRTAVSETWSAVLCWLKPPYLYIVTNFIILAIAASSRSFHTSKSQPSVTKTPPPSVFASALPPPRVEEVRSTAEIGAEDDELLSVDGKGESTASVYGAPPTQEEGIDALEMTAASLLRAREKPLMSSRFGHRRPVGTGVSHGGEARGALLGVSRPRKQETLESTWKKITEGRSVPLTRHLKNKTDDWDDKKAAGADVSKKHGRSSNGRMMHKELSPSHVELNRRIEAFINDFNEDMKMQRQESLNRFMEMMNRGV